MEQFFPLLILAIWIFASLAKRKKKTTSGDKNPAPGKLKASLLDLVQQVKEEIRKAQTHQQPGLDQGPAADEAAADEELWIEPAEGLPPPVTSDGPPATDRLPLKRKIPPAPPLEKITTPGLPASTLATGPATLETAMIWHEILSPPVSCRPDRG
jgi:hypothetical protein